MGKNCPDPQRAIGVLQRRRVPLRKGERQRIGGAVYKQSADVPKLNANDQTSRTHIIREWTHSHFHVPANGNPRAHAMCE